MQRQHAWLLRLPLVALGAVVALAQWGTIRPSDAAAGAGFGGAAAFAPAGDFLVTGAPGASSSQGAAYLFAWASASATQRAVLRAADGAAGDLLGTAVAVACQASRPQTPLAIVGAPGRAGGTGGAYVFACASGNGACSQAALLLAGDAAAGDALGSAVAVSQSAAGTTSWVIAAGAPFRSGAAGAVYTFACSNASGVLACVPASLLTDAVGAGGSQLGAALAMSATGSVIAAGAPYAGAGQQGAVALFSCSAGTGAGCVQATAGMLRAADASNAAAFGAAVALSADGSVLAVGAPSKSQYSAALAGGVYVYACAGTGAALACALRATLAAARPLLYGAFGAAVALAPSDASALLVGAPTNSARLGPGAAYLLVRNPPASGDVGSWYEEAVYAAPPGGAVADLFGGAVAIALSAAAGPTLAVGAAGDGTAGAGAGVAYALVVRTMTQTPSQTPSQAPSPSQTPSQAVTASQTPTGTATASGTPSTTATPTLTRSQTRSQTASVTGTRSQSPSLTGTRS